MSMPMADLALMRVSSSLFLSGPRFMRTLVPVNFGLPAHLLSNGEYKKKSLLGLGHCFLWMGNDRSWRAAASDLSMGAAADRGGQR